MEKQRLLYLIDFYVKGLINSEERSELMNWYHTVNEQEEEWLVAFPNEEKKIRQEILQSIQKKIKSNKRLFLLRYAAVAIPLLFCICIAFYFMQKTHSINQAKIQQTTIPPGENKAFLTLADGSQVTLSDSNHGVIALEGNMTVNQTKNGQIVYRSSSAKAVNTIIQNMISTPKGGQYHVILSDGTQAWLNSESSLSYPVTFSQKDRKVSVRGEVYFEVAKDVNHPFIVSTRQSSIHVLGTHFNIMSYDNEPVEKTTIVEGSVKVVLNQNNKSVVITPNQQANINDVSKDIKINNVNAEAIVSWIHGFLSIETIGVREFMNQLSRWYNVDVVYRGDIPKGSFGGVLNRGTNLTDMLAALNAGGLHLRLEGRVIVVLEQ